ncbi:MAG: hypothetical protein GEV12_00605 [Micromonosporaceae bacterium]|nr:hypothetical protein [Micromonosporaceae bacterium]
MKRPNVVRALLASDEPSVRWKVRVHVLGEDPASPTNRRLQQQIRTSPRVRALLDGAAPESYRKWQGRHWVLQTLADIGHPAGDERLEPLAASVTRTWLHRRYYGEYDPSTAPRSDAVPLIAGRFRRCGSQHGGALLALVRLGLGGDAADRLVERLLHWQWSDGGWNCHRKATAATSSVYETLLPMRGLAAHGSAPARQAADRAAEVLLTRRVLFRRTNGQLIRKEWTRLHYPVYWRYDVLAGLKGLWDAGHLDDPRCHDALDLLESKQLPDGGWAAEATFSHGVDRRRPSADLVGWDGPAAHRMNEWVTADTLAVLAAAGRR